MTALSFQTITVLKYSSSSEASRLQGEQLGTLIKSDGRGLSHRPFGGIWSSVSLHDCLQ